MKLTRRELLASAAAAAGAPAAISHPTARGRSFTKDALREVAFPIGGIGTGTVSLGGCGQFRDWEIFNRPGKGSILPFTFVSARFEGGGLAKPRIRVLERQPLPPFNQGDGYIRTTGLGLPRFREAVFSGSYPFAGIRFHDPKLPVAVSLEAFNPMIPLDTAESSLPVALLSYRFTSRAPSDIKLAVAFSAMNPIGFDGAGKLSQRNAPFFGKNRNEFRRQDSAAGLLMSSAKYAPDSPRHGSLAILSTGDDFSYRAAWEHGAWWDDFQKWWDEFEAKGRFASQPAPESGEGRTEYATLANHLTLAPGETRTVTFALAWHFPLRENYWSGHDQAAPPPLHNDYANRWPSAWEPAAYALNNHSRLHQATRDYRDTLYSSTLPADVIDAVSSQSCIPRTTTLMVLDGGHALGFEGCHDNSGCCPMNCTHVYNYEHTLAFLYPDLERSMRDIDFSWNMRADGSMSFRTPLPFRQGGNDFRPAADGQMGTVIKMYREWQLGGSDDWLRKYWPQVKRALEYAWVQWDANRDGLMEGEQHNTYDIEFYGPNSMTGAFYLGALRAGAEMARHLGDTAAADRYLQLAQKGAAGLDRLLYNGEYYVQKVDESKPKAKNYQYGEGCLSDQVLGQWFAEVVDLGKLLPHDHVKSALSSIFRHNFCEDFSDFPNVQRIYAMNEEKGLLLCSWPRGKRPALPFPYSDEVWTGIEYQVASHLIYEGFLREGLAIVSAVRGRYSGTNRNPWDEFECGHHYARAMSSWSLLTALSGFACSAPRKEIKFSPRINADNFRSLFSSGTAWGSYAQQRTKGKLTATIEVKGGRLELEQVRLPWTEKTARASSAAVKLAGSEARLTLHRPVRLKVGDRLTLVVTA
ncbi:MAG: hypothetical protein IT160_03915 [Bryobacterales bacterium]|nr:hypothetical protein [Bryobacterales bacterium]